MGKRILFFMVIALALFSCEEDPSSYLPAHSGGTGEIIVIMEDAYWEGQSGDAIREKMEEYYPHLPQPEYMFSLVQFPQSSFSKIIKVHRNIIIADIRKSTQNEEPTIEIVKDKWAKEQLVVEVHASSEEDFIRVFKEHSQKVSDYFNDVEKERLKEKYFLQRSVNLEKTLMEQHQLSLTLPTDCEIAADEKNFVWIKRNRVKFVGSTGHDVTQGILIYHYPYVDDSTFTPEYLLMMRDSINKQYVPGPSDGSYMTTEYKMPPSYTDKVFNDEYAAEIRGLWRVEGDFMGGPFMSLTTYDEKRGRIVTVEGFVFAPKFDKREYLRELEAMLYSLKFAE